MKKNVKGFTLIELIVVMAIFGVIMFGAMRLVVPVLKMMVQSDVHEGGNAAVSNISSYLENELSVAEYMIASNDVPDDKGKAYVEEFVKSYYEGVLKAGCTAESPAYGKGLVHVLTIDNTQNGKISNYIYDVKFDLGNPGVTLKSEQDFAINKAYYDSYSFTIKSGLYEDNTFDPTQPDTYEELISNLSTKETVFTIQASTVRNNTTYSFLSNATMSLVNIYNRKGAGVPGAYYVVNEEWDSNNNVLAKTITDITTPNLSKLGDPYNNGAGNFSQSRQYGGVLNGSKVLYVDGSTEGYCFVYSYGSEMDTQ